MSRCHAGVADFFEPCTVAVSECGFSSDEDCHDEDNGNTDNTEDTQFDCTAGNATDFDPYPYHLIKSELAKFYLRLEVVSPDMPPAEQWNGVIKATVLPPQDLSVPVLPYKCGGKLMFPLCRTCAEEESPHLCNHFDPKQRILTGTWCAPEIRYAILKKSYTLLTTHEIYQYPGTMRYDPDSGTDGLLSAYVRCFMALKIQASGWPEDCDTDEKREAYIADVLKHDGIRIDPDKVEKNSALRVLSKLMNNAFWGKFGERTLRPKTTFVYDYAELMRLVTDPAVEVQSLLPLGENCLQVAYTPIKDSESSLPTSSLLHAAFTTCHGRMKLYEYLDIVQTRALYCDTDSVSYISRPGEPELPLGTHLGDLSDQIAEDYGPNSFITEFVAGGPKNYSFRVAVGGDTKNSRVSIKVRGISITKSCHELVTFDNLKAMVLKGVEKKLIPVPHQIVRLPKWRIVTRNTSKTWRAKNTKRRRVDNETTVPHGFNPWGGEAIEDQEVLEALDLLQT
ncbi:Formate acetyltransferase [Frankliniella fusca]|uniref:Formate acetyltransferase n=1 Tax=Frankliniella fusca TaxID=407009 RepID=A0AAE1LI27_9NEOP|nr:Formate acetyltransferase [Frankliniella fusca]